MGQIPGGFGTGHQQKTHGGHGAIETSDYNYKTLSTEERTGYGLTTNTATTSNTTSSDSNADVLNMMQKMIDVLKEIGVNTSKIEDLESGGTTNNSVNNGGNIVVTNNNDNSTTQTTSTTTDSRNAQLSKRIARGY
jgi:hypothetical protein